MKEIITDRTLETIATEINSIRDQTKNIVLQSSVEIGRRLVEAKAMVGHGNWENWLKTSVDYSQRTAGNLIKIFQEYGTGQQKLFGTSSNSQALADLNYTQAIALLGIPTEEERIEFAETHNMNEMSTRELQQAIKDRDAANQKAEKLAKDLQETIDAKEKTAEKSKKYKEQKDAAEKQLKELKTKINSPALDVDPGRVDALEKKLVAKQAEIEELEEKLTTPVDIEPVTVEKIPEATVQELKELREQLEKLQNAPKPEKQEEAVLQFKMYFELTKTNFNKLLESLGAIENPEIREKYKAATVKVLDMMKEYI